MWRRKIKKSEFHIFGWFTMKNLLCSKFWNYFPAEIIPRSPPIIDFLIAFHMVWKNQESWEPWLVAFWVSRCWKMQNISANKFFFSFLNHDYGFTTYLEILNLLLSDVISRIVSACRIFHITTVWQILIKFWDGSCPSLHHVKF